MNTNDFLSQFNSAKTGPQSEKKVARLSERLADFIAMSHPGDEHNVTLLVDMAEFLAQKETGIPAALEAAVNATSYCRDDSTEKRALAVWSKNFDRLTTEAEKVTALERIQEVVIAGTPLERAYTEKWDAMPDSKIKRDARKTPEFYAGLRDKMQQYGIQNIDRKLEDIEPLKYDTRGWSDFVSQAQSTDNMIDGFRSLEKHRAMQPQASAETDPDEGLQRLLAKLRDKGIFSDNAPSLSAPAKIGFWSGSIETFEGDAAKVRITDAMLGKLSRNRAVLEKLLQQHGVEKAEIMPAIHHSGKRTVAADALVEVLISPSDHLHSGTGGGISEIREAVEKITGSPASVSGKPRMLFDDIMAAHLVPLRTQERDK